jgi:hypothetical protein
MADGTSATDICRCSGHTLADFREALAVFLHPLADFRIGDPSVAQSVMRPQAVSRDFVSARPAAERLLIRLT